MKNGSFVGIALCVLISACSGGDAESIPSSTPAHSATVGIQGGTVQGPDQVTLAVPANAVANPTVVSIARDGGGAPDLIGVTLLSPIYAITPHGARFNTNALLNLPYDNAKFPGAQAFVLRGESDGTWHVQPVEGVQPGVAQINVSSLSWFAVGMCTPGSAGTFGFDSSDCPASYSLQLEVLDSNGSVVSIPRDAQGRALPLAQEINVPTDFVLRLTWTRPVGITRNDDLLLAGGGPGFGIASLVSWTANQTTFAQNVPLHIDPAAIPNATSPNGVVRRLQASASYCFVGPLTSGGASRRVPWNFDRDVAFRIRDTGIQASAPVIVTQPVVAVRYRSNRFVRSGATLTVVATGSPPLSYQWYRDGQLLTDRIAGDFTSSVAGANTDTLTLDNVQVSDAGFYTVEVSNGISPNAVSTSGGLGVLPQQVIEGSPFTALAPHISIDANGSALAVWKQTDGTRFNIWAGRYTSSGQWEVPQLISANSTNVGDADSPRIAIETNGNALAFWAQLDDQTQRSHIWVSRYLDGSWRNPQRIDPNTSINAVTPQAQFDADGNALVVWQQSDGTRSSIWACSYGGSNLCETPEAIGAVGAGNATSPQVAVDTAGNALAVWQQSNGARLDIWANRYVSDDGWGTAQLIEADDAGDAKSPQIDIDASGNALAVWQQSDGMRFNIWANRFATTSGWQSARLIETNDGGDANLPKIAFDAAGNALAVWHQVYGAGSDATGMPIPLHLIWANRCEVQSGEWRTARTFSSNDARNENQNAFDPQVAISANGDAVLVWTTEFTQEQVRYRVITGQRNKPENLTSLSSGPTSRLSVGTALIQPRAPQVVIDSKGNALAVWQEQFSVSNPNIWSTDVP